MAIPTNKSCLFSHSSMHVCCYLFVNSTGGVTPPVATEFVFRSGLPPPSLPLFLPPPHTHRSSRLFVFPFLLLPRPENDLTFAHACCSMGRFKNIVECFELKQVFVNLNCVQFRTITFCCMHESVPRWGERGGGRGGGI